MFALTPSSLPESSLTTTTTTTTTKTPTNFIQTTLSYNSNLMLAAIISLLLVILFVLLLHIYARWFLVTARQRSRSSVTVPHVLASRFTIIDTAFDSSSSTSNGLHPSQISSLPLFVYNHNKKEDQNGLECAICISLFEEEEVGRKLPKCGHAFHVECIDMWLSSHSTCPICRDEVLCEDTKNMEEINDDLMSESHFEVDIIEDLNTENVDDNSSVMNESGDRFSCSESDSTLSGRLKRMLSTNRSEHKIHPSAGDVIELEVV